MRLTSKQLEFYEDNGFILLPGCFSPAHVAVVKNEIPPLLAEETLRRVIEKSGDVRSVYGSHSTNAILKRLSQHSNIVEPAMQIVNSPVYVYQFKINAKVAFSGDIWEWHQDYVFWLKEDGMPASRVTNAAVFLDEVHEFNGPLFLIPGSHKEGVIDVAAHEETGQTAEEHACAASSQYRQPWLSNLTADLKYSLSKKTVAGLVEKYGITAPKGEPGSVLFFHGNLVHGSPNNISPFDRAVILVTFNSVANVPALTEKSRPEFLVSRDIEPIVALEDDALVA